MPLESRNRGILLALLVVVFLAAGVQVLHSKGVPGIPAVALAGLRWVAIALLAAHAMMRRSLTLWIFVGMAAGAELGFDSPATAMHFQVLGAIFLRLTKLIIAPLLFGTLVVGIAGHADLKKVGRMGIKAIVYFEIVSTIAILIGLAAINISRAGVGVQLPAVADDLKNVIPHTASELILNIFPEN